MKTLIYFTNLVSICMNTWINTLFYIRLLLVCVISSLIWISSLILCTTSLYALAGPKIGQIKSCILYLVSLCPPPQKKSASSVYFNDPR